MFENEGLEAPQPVIETASLSLLLQLVRSTDLLTVLPDLRFSWVTRGLAPIESPRMRWRRSSGMFRRKDAVMTPALKSFVDELLHVVRRHYGPRAPDEPRLRDAAGAAELRRLDAPA